MEEIRIRNLFILGAGFTKAVFPDAPLNDDLLQTLIGTEPDNSPLGVVWKKYGDDNIERLLTKFDIDLFHNKSEFDESHRERISAQIGGYFGRYRFEKDISWLSPFKESLSENDVIISLNYDCFLEGYLDYHQIWSPKGGYHSIRNMLDDDMPENTRNIRILKIHGSENFRSSSYADKKESKHLSFEIGPAYFPRSEKYSHIGGGPSDLPFVISPSFTKFYGVELNYLFLDALKFANQAKKLIIIGCGFRLEDAHLWQIITSFMKSPKWKEKKTLIINPAASVTKEQIAKYWGVSIFDENNLVAMDSKLQPSVDKLKEFCLGS